MIRPVGVSAGGLGLALAWFGGLAIAELTGATPVVIVLAAGLVLFVAAVVDGFVGVLRTSVESITLPATSTQGRPTSMSVGVVAPRPVWLDVRSGRDSVAAGWASRSTFDGEAEFIRRGAVQMLGVKVRTAGLLGLVWWGRRFTVDIDRHLVAPPAHSGSITVERSGLAADGERSGAAGAVSGEIDGLRTWRDGDSERFVHWSSTVRAGELMVHDRREEADQRWVVRARSGTPDPDREAGAARAAIEQGLRSGARVDAAVDHHEPHAIEHFAEAARWAALAPVGEQPSGGKKRRRWWRVEPDAATTVPARWWAAGATTISLWMLAGALGYSLIAWMLIALGVAASAAVSARSVRAGGEPSTLVRTLTGLAALAGFALVVAATGRLDGLLAVLRGPLPQVLVLLILLHGVECRDRRTIRVSLGISAIVLMYAAGLRVDGAIAWWLIAWAAVFGIAMSKLAGPDRAVVGGPTRHTIAPARTWLLRTVGLTTGLAATIGVLTVVPVPDGAARLTLPTLIENAEGVPNLGGVAGPDGDARGVDDRGDGRRAPAGRAGGYTGFAETMDTSVRGDLSDEVVMRVRAPEADFWRGQTFAEFDGRRWYADPDPGMLRRGPNIELPPALGDISVAVDVEVDRFVQTYFLETDMPNIVFHSGRPSQLIAETDVYARSDGALRATTVLPEGSIYTVVSDRVRVDDALLHRQGLIGERLNALGRQLLAPYLAVPESTTPETVGLADELADGATSTYEVVRAYERWMNQNVEYDLDAPLPAQGEDAVHDFLFDSRLGFCEQIASALTVMLRTQGVPARLATGYVSGTRDEIAGVFEVRASDAHAWVEVWFPESGWQAFDPTAAVPLSADAERLSVGADLLSGASSYIGDRPTTAVFAVIGVVGLAFLTRLGWTLLLRRRRGRWGGLQDRFTALAVDRGLPGVTTNPARAGAWTASEDAGAAQRVAERLDRIAFDREVVDDDDTYRSTRTLVRSLERTRR